MMSKFKFCNCSTSWFFQLMIEFHCFLFIEIPFCFPFTAYFTQSVFICVHHWPPSVVCSFENNSHAHAQSELFKASNHLPRVSLLIKIKWKFILLSIWLPIEYILGVWTQSFFIFHFFLSLSLFRRSIFILTFVVCYVVCSAPLQLIFLRSKTPSILP